MYVPPAFAEDRPEMLTALMAAHPLATVVTHGENGLAANLIPVVHHPADDGAPAVLRAHLARANGQLADLRAMEQAGAPVLVLFQGAQAYVSPAWYATKAETGKVVPTWNYLAVQVRGVPRVIDDADWLRAQVADLTDRLESSEPAPWGVGGALVGSWVARGAVETLGLASLGSVAAVLFRVAGVSPAPWPVLELAGRG